MNRRRFLAAAGATAIAGTAASVDGLASTSRPDLSPVRDGPSIGLEPVVSGFREPVAFRTARGGRLRYVADKYGGIYLQDDEGLRERPVLDLSDSLAEFESWEQGLVGFELHPDFESNGRCFVRYSSKPLAGTPADFSHTFVLSEFTATDDLRGIDRDSERKVLTIPEPGPDHNSGAVNFGPDGYLYVGVGDGGDYKWSGDRANGHADDWYWLNAGGNGQDVTENMLGSLLRIDVDGRDDGKEYAVPDDNPLVGREGLDEHWAWGLRNPYRMSFSGGELYVGDVGRDRVEEVNRVVKGGNYGWNVREGDVCHSNRLSVAALAELPWFEKTFPVCPDETADGEPLVDPVVSYPHYVDGEPFGRAVICGHVYENETVAALRGEFFFADMRGPGSSLYTATPEDDGLWAMKRVDVASGPDMAGRYVLSVDRDDAGELYVLTTQFAEGSGAVHRVVPAP